MAALQDLRRDALREVAGHREANPLAAARDHRVDPQHVSLQVAQGTARVAGVDARVGLEVVLDGVHPEAAAALGREDTGRHRVAEAEGRPDRDDPLADARRVGIAEARRREARRVDLDDGEVGRRVSTDEGRRQVPPVPETHVDRERVLDDMVVRENRSVGREDDPGAHRAGDRLVAARAADPKSRESMSAFSSREVTSIWTTLGLTRSATATKASDMRRASAVEACTWAGAPGRSRSSGRLARAEDAGWGCRPARVGCETRRAFMASAPSAHGDKEEGPGCAVFRGVGPPWGRGRWGRECGCSWPESVRTRAGKYSGRRSEGATAGQSGGRGGEVAARHARARPTASPHGGLEHDARPRTRARGACARRRAARCPGP